MRPLSTRDATRRGCLLNLLLSPTYDVNASRESQITAQPRWNVPYSVKERNELSRRWRALILSETRV